jgi:hypothetical protein
VVSQRTARQLETRKISAAGPAEHRLGAHAQAMSHGSGGQQWSIRIRGAELIEPQTVVVDRHTCTRRLSTPGAAFTRKAGVAAAARSAIPKVGGGSIGLMQVCVVAFRCRTAGASCLPRGRMARPLGRPEAA